MAWNRHAEELWGLRSDEVSGKHLPTSTSGCRSSGSDRR